MGDKISRMRRTNKKLTGKLGRKPTDYELAEELGISIAKL